MKKFFTVLLVVVLLTGCFTLSACDNKYLSRYNATSMSKSVGFDLSATSYQLTFGKFNGVLSFKLTNKSGSEATLFYSITLGDGSAKVYYDYADEKVELIDLSSQKVADSQLAKIPARAKVYIIIESDGDCFNGKFYFDMQW